MRKLTRINISLKPWEESLCLIPALQEIQPSKARTEAPATHALDSITYRPLLSTFQPDPADRGVCFQCCGSPDRRGLDYFQGHTPYMYRPPELDSHVGGLMSKQKCREKIDVSSRTPDLQSS